MNIEQAKASVGKRVVCFDEYLKDKDLWIQAVHTSNNSSFVTLGDSFGNHHDVSIDEIEFRKEEDIYDHIQKQSNQDLRKDIALLLIRQGHYPDASMKEAVSYVVEAIEG